VSDAATLESFRLADSFLPVGTYTVSYGLEQFIQDDRVEDAADLQALLSTYLRQQVGPAELIALRAAHAAATEGDLDAVCRADRRLSAVTLAAEFRESAQQSGDRLLSLQTDLRDEALLDLAVREACLLCCHGFVTGLLGAAQRLLSLGHTDAQRILDDLQSVITAAVDESADREIDEMAPFAPLVDVLAAEHERAERRLFAS
jgi:urease accessory protein